MKKRVICIDISTGSFEDLMNRVLDDAASRKSSYACVANVHMLVEAYKDPLFARVVNQADFAFADGMPIAKSIDYLYGETQERVAGVEIIQHLLKASSKKNLKVAFYGGTQEIQDKTKEYVEKNYPELKALYKPHPFR